MTLLPPFSRFAPAAALGVLALPVLAGFAGTLLPAFGYLPAVGFTEFSLEPFRELVEEPGVGRSVWLSFQTGLLSTLVSVIIVAGFVAAWFGHNSFLAVRSLISPLLAVPHAAAALGLAFMIAPSGFLVRLISPELTGWDRPPDLLIVNDQNALALTAGLIVKEVPFLFLITMAALPQVPVRRSLRLTAGLGYGQLAGFLLVTWPMIYRQIRLGIFAVLAFASSVVDVSIILGPTIPSTLAVRLVEWMNDPDLSRRTVACAGACVQIAVTGALLLFWIVVERVCATIARVILANGHRFERDIFVRQCARAAMVTSAALVFAGLAMMAVWSFAGLWTYPDALPQNLNLRTWSRALPSLSGHVSTTLLIGVSATLLSIALVLGCLQRETEIGKNGTGRALYLLYLPLIIPQVGFLFGLQFLLVSGNADASLAALILVHMIFVLPYVFLSLAPPWRAQDRRYDRVALALGASQRKVFWRIRVPMLLRAILAAMAVGFAVSVAQYLPTLLVGAGRFSTVTTEAVALGTGGNRRVVGVYAFVQMLLPFVGFLLATIIPALLFRNRRAINLG
ncbi:MAG: ABC transporter permease [Pseudomonadota bacterium]